VQTEINNGNIRNLDKAAFIANIVSPELRKQAIVACVNGSSLKELRHIVNHEKTSKQTQKTFQASTRGRTTTKINMGTTLKANVIKTIVDCVLTQKQLHQHTSHFSQVNWKDLRQTTKAFRKLIELLEVETVV